MARVFKNTLSVMLARTIDGISSFILIAIVARYLDVKDYGIYAFAMSYVIFLTPLAYGGIERLAIHELSVNRGTLEKYVGMLLALTGVLTVLFIFISLAGLLFFEKSGDLLTAILLAAAGQIAFSISSVYLSLFRAVERMELDIMLSIVFQIIMLGATFITVKYNLGLAGILGAFTAASLVRSLSAWLLCRMLDIRAVMGTDVWDKMIGFAKKSFSLGLSIMLMQGILNIDVLLLRFMMAPEDVSYFYAAHNLMWKFNKAIPAAMAIAVFPLVSALSINSFAEDFRNLYRRLFKLFYISAIFVAIAAVMYSDNIIGLVYGEKYAVAADAFRVLMIGEVFVFVFMFLELAIISVERQNLLITSTALALAIKVVLGVLLIPVYGFVGSAIASLVGYALLTVLTFHYMSVSAGHIPAGDLIRPLGAATPVAIFFYYSGIVRLSPVVALSAGAMIYVLMLFVLRSVSIMEIHSFRKALASRRPVENVVDF